MSDPQAKHEPTRPPLMDHPLNRDHCCLTCDAVFAFGDLRGNTFPPRCPECGGDRTCSVALRDQMEDEDGKRT